MPDVLPVPSDDPRSHDPRASWVAILSGATLVAVLIALPRLLLGEGSSILIHDNLDSEIVYRMWLGLGGRALDYGATIDETIGGLPRAFLVSGLNATVGLFALLPPFWAYAVNQVIVHVVTFVGMYLLVRDYCAPLVAPRTPPEVPWLVAVAFALLPFYSIYGLSVSGVPLTRIIHES